MNTTEQTAVKQFSRLRRPSFHVSAWLNVLCNQKI